MELLIKNGLIIDGSGSQGYKSDILIKEDKIVKIGKNLETQQGKIIDASSKIVSPGFIDMHSHADLTILQVNTAEAYLMQGVTTLACGMCGLGIAPANDKVRKYYSTLVKSIIGSSRLNLFESIKEFTEELDRKGISPNLALFIPHGNVRTCILGMEDRVPTQKELKAMKNLIRRGMENGAFGLSTGLIYPPGILTSKQELIEVCKVLADYNGIYDSHMRNEGTRIIDIGMSELIDIARTCKIQAQISHWKAGINSAWYLTSDMINFVNKARKEGLKIFADVYPYEESSTSLSGILLKPWVYNSFQENLTDLNKRQKIVNEFTESLSSSYISSISQDISNSELQNVIFAYLMKKIRIISVLYHHEIEGLMLGKALKNLYPTKNFPDALLDFIRDEEGSIMISVKQMSERKSILSLFKQEFVSIGSDGFLVTDSNTHPRSYGTFPKILSRYIREKGIVSLEEGIRKMTSLPASILHLRDRGIIKPDYKADIVVFDFNTIKDMSTYENGRQFPAGIEYVIVNGKITIENGKHLGTLNGKVLKHRP
ncbi:MAG: amidohydrolase family protein [Candidatus Hermodarchaeota archaeon]